MNRPLTALPARVLAPALALAGLTVLTGCESMQLPPGYAWNVTQQEQNDIKTPRGSYRWGFDQSRVNESLPTTSRDSSRYNFAAALPSPTVTPAPYAATQQPGDPLLRADVPPTARPLGRVETDPVFAAGPAAFSSPTQAPAPSPVAQGSFRAPAEVRILTSPGADANYAPSQPAASSGPRTHTVQKGDNYWDLSRKYYGKGIRFTDIQKANPDKNPTKLQIGDTLIIPE